MHKVLWCSNSLTPSSISSASQLKEKLPGAHHGGQERGGEGLGLGEESGGGVHGGTRAYTGSGDPYASRGTRMSSHTGTGRFHTSTIH